MVQLAEVPGQVPQAELQEPAVVLVQGLVPELGLQEPQQGLAETVQLRPTAKLGPPAEPTVVRQGNSIA